MFHKILGPRSNTNLISLRKREYKSGSTVIRKLTPPKFSLDFKRELMTISKPFRLKNIAHRKLAARRRRRRRCNMFKKPFARWKFRSLNEKNERKTTYFVLFGTVQHENLNRIKIAISFHTFTTTNKQRLQNCF